MGDNRKPRPDPVGVLRRWEDAGGVWRVAAVGSRSASVVLFRCDGGEEVERFTSDDPALLAFLADRAARGTLPD